METTTTTDLTSKSYLQNFIILKFYVETLLSPDFPNVVESINSIKNFFASS